MMRKVRLGVAATLVALLVIALAVVTRIADTDHRTRLVGYFANSNGLFAGDEVRILGVPVGAVDTIEPQVDRVKISFWVDSQYRIPADANAVVLAPSLVTSRAIQLTPAYTSGPEMHSGAVIPEQRTAVPVEWDDFREQLDRLTETLQPQHPGGVSSMGALINTAADNLRGEGANIRDTIIKLSQAFSALGDHSGDVFGTVRNLSVLTTALESSTDLMRQLNRNLAAVTGLLANDPTEIDHAVNALSSVSADVAAFVEENRETLGTTSDKIASVSTALVQSIDDLKQTLHLTPTVFQNFTNIYQPSQGALTGALVVNNFANPVSFLCGAVQAASRLGAEQSAKLCAQYLAPIVKNRQYNFPPIGINPFVGQTARPNEVTYSEDWMRPDYVPPLTAEAPTAATEPSEGLPGMMVPGAGS